MIPRETSGATLPPSMFHVKHFCVKDCRPRVRKTRFCKTTPCIKNSSLNFKNMTLRTFGTSETGEDTEARPERRRQGPQRQDRQALSRARPPGLAAADCLCEKILASS